MIIVITCLLSIGCEKEEEPTLPTVTTAEVTDITQTGAKTGGEVISDGNATVTARGVCWSTSENPTIEDNKTEDGSGTGEFNSTVFGLAPNAKYYLRAYATNSEGTSYGNQREFNTPI